MSKNEFYNLLLDLEQDLVKFAYHLTQRKSDAKDLVQETLLKGLLNQDKYVSNENFKAWTFTIMKNTFINDYRHSSRQITSLDQTEGSFSNHQPISYSSEDPDSAYSCQEITQIIEQLNETVRTPFIMHFHGYRYQEIADTLNLNIGTVKSRIFLSRKQLKDRLNR